MDAPQVVKAHRLLRLVYKPSAKMRKSTASALSALKTVLYFQGGRFHVRRHLRLDSATENLRTSRVASSVSDVMTRLPKRISPCPIVGAVAEIRFSADVPEDAVFGMVYPAFQKQYPNPVRLPIMELPQPLRNGPELAFAAFHQLRGDGYNIQIGPHVFNVVAVPPYQGWSSFSKKISEAFTAFFQKLLPTELIRLSLRYSDFFEGDVLPRTRLRLALDDLSLSGPEMMIRTLIERDGFQHLLNFSNSAAHTTLNGTVRGTLIDVDSLVRKVPPQFSSDQGLREKTLNDLHLSGKRLFFATLQDEYLNTLNPEY